MRIREPNQLWDDRQIVNRIDITDLKASRLLCIVKERNLKPRRIYWPDGYAPVETLVDVSQPMLRDVLN